MTSREALIRLQEIDLELIQTQKHTEGLSERKQLVTLRKQIKKVSAEASRVVGQHKDLCMSVDEKTEERLSLEIMMDEARARAESQTDYRALQDTESQLTMLAKRIERIDFDLSNIQSEINAKVSKASEYRSWLKQARSQEQQLLQSFTAAVEQAADKLATLKRERQAIVDAMDTAVYEHYEKASRRFGGLAVERLNGNTPSICRVSLQASQYAQALSGEGVGECPYCHRILISN